MSQPKIEIIPAKAAIPRQLDSTLDILIRITPPPPDVHFIRPQINLGLVLDRSGSMAGAKKMEYAKQAAAFAVTELLPEDRVSVTIFDNIVETIVPNAPAHDKTAIVQKIEGIRPRNATALHAGWKEGAEQVTRNLIKGGLNRVILLSDGLANEGVTDPNVIAGECKSRANFAVSTTTMGLGNDYNEDLMQRMAENGDGNYYFIETPQQLADIFHTELKGLMANVGSKVSLGLEPQSGSSVAEVLNDMERNVNGRLMLPNLSVGMPIQVVLRLRVPACLVESEVCRFRLAWDDPKTGERLLFYAGLVMPSASQAEWEAMTADPRVTDQVAFQMAARAKKEAVQAFDRGDYVGTRQYLEGGMAFLACASTGTAESDREMDEMKEIAAHLNEGEKATFRKKALWQFYRKKTGRE